MFSLKLEKAGRGHRFKSGEGVIPGVVLTSPPSSSLAGVLIPVTWKESQAMPRGQRKEALKPAAQGPAERVLGSPNTALLLSDVTSYFPSVC